MLTLCRRSSDEQVQKMFGSNLLTKLKCANKYVEPYYPTQIRLNSESDSAIISDTISIDSRNIGSYTNLDLQYNSSIRPLMYPENNGAQANLKTPNNKFKTELCKNYDLNGYCKWANNCFFAHGKAELKSKLPVSQFYKTKICKHFHKGGVCPYGSRCQYFHFKTYEMNQELRDSLEKKLIVRVSESDTRLDAILNASDRTQRRLPVYKRLYGGDVVKSLQEKFYDNEF